MYFGPFRLPGKWVWLAAAAITALSATVAALGVNLIIPVVIAFVVILVIAAPRRASGFGAKEMRDSRPEQ